ncbi:hypothetical protein VNO78_22281 [Psophocarpus tetragonolobus]|uniref:Uncharacterized protein n=1 Tax=Psophocarpus tetragonolobus TaxID=3891 RepID=A0AAN9SHW9_PSOTE
MSILEEAFVNTELSKQGLIFGLNLWVGIGILMSVFMVFTLFLLSLHCISLESLTLCRCLQISSFRTFLSLFLSSYSLNTSLFTVLTSSLFTPFFKVQLFLDSNTSLSPRKSNLSINQTLTHLFFNFFQIISSLTTSLRFDGAINVDIIQFW